MSLEVCPSCGDSDSIYQAFGPAIGLDGRLYGGRREAFCDNESCDQRYWFYPETCRITRRNTGIAYKQYRLQRVALQTVNAMREAEGMTLLVDDPATLDRRKSLAQMVVEDVQAAVGPEAVDEVLASCPPPPAPDPSTDPGVPWGGGSIPDLRRFLFEKWCTVRAFFVVFVPGFRRFSVCKEDDND